MALSLGGDWLVTMARIPVPGSIVGMLALTLLVELGVVPVRAIQPGAGLLVRHLALFFVPAGVALLGYLAVVRHDLVAISVAALASLVAVLAVVGLVIQRLERGG